LLVATRPDIGTDRDRVRRSFRPEWIILVCYLAAAILVTSRIWSDPAALGPTAGGKAKSDVYLNIWFMRYAANALVHGHLPALVTTGLNWPEGVNAMWNTSLLVPGVLLAPVTLLAGPSVSLAILLTLGFAGSAATLFIVLRSWGARLAGAAIGGALYGFSPAIMVAAEDHYHLQFAVLPPLIVDAVLRLATGRGSPVRVGLWLGGLVAVQLFIAEELLVDTAIVAGVLVLCLALARPGAILGRLRGAATGLALAAGVAIALGGYALWVQFHGPLTEHGSPWQIGRYGNHPASFVTAPFAMALHGRFQHFLRATRQWPVEVYAYLGWPLVAALIAAPFVFWRDFKIRITGLAFLAVAWLSLGGHRQHVLGIRIPAHALPWHYLEQVPILDEVVVNRLSILADGLAAAVIALCANRVIQAVRVERGWRKPAFAAAAAASLAAIVTPIVPRPVPAGVIIPPPAGWRKVINGLRLPAGAPVLVLPFNTALTMEWQATTDEPISVVGGYCVAPAANGKATQCDNQAMETPPERTTQLQAVWLAYRQGRPGPSLRAFSAALLEWHPAALVVTPQSRLALAHYVQRYLGPATVQRGRTRGWRLGPAQYRVLDSDYALGRRQLPAAAGSQALRSVSLGCRLAGNCWVTRAADAPAPLRLRPAGASGGPGKFGQVSYASTALPRAGG
jgi:hypothetical protein